MVAAFGAAASSIRVLEQGRDLAACMYQLSSVQVEPLYVTGASAVFCWRTAEAVIWSCTVHGLALLWVLALMTNNVLE